MDEMYIRTVHSLIASLDSRTTKQERFNCQQYVDDLKNGAENYLLLSKIVFDPEISEEIHLLSLTIFHEWIRMWWRSISIDRQLEIRAICSQLLNQLAIRSCSGGFCSKFASILCEIAERQFPQQWSTLVEDLSVVWTQSHSRVAQEIVMKSLQFIYSDCTDNEFTNHLTSSRRQELLAGLKVSEGTVLALSYEYFTSNSLHLHSADPLLKASSRKAVAQTVDLLLAMQPVLDSVELLDHNRNFLLLLLKILNVEELQIECLNLLQNLFHHEFSQDHLLKVFQAIACEKFISFPPNKDAFLLFIRCYATAVVKLISHNMKSIAELVAWSAEGVLYLQRILSELLQCYETDSWKIVGETIVDFTKLYRSEKVQETLFAKELVEKLLLQFRRRSIRPLFLEGSDRFGVGISYPDWFEVEFDGIDDFNGYHVTALSHFVSFVTVISEHFPQEWIRFLKKELSQQEDPTISSSTSNGAFQLINSYLQPCSTAVSKKLRTDPLLYEAVRQIIDFLQQANSIDHHHLSQYKYRILGNLFVWVEILHEDRQLNVFDLLQQSFLSLKEPRQESRHMAEETSEFLSLFIPKILKFADSDEVLLKLLNEVIFVCTCTSLPIVKSRMREVLVVLSTKASGNLSLQRQILSAAFQPELNRLAGLVEAVLKRPELLLDMMADNDDVVSTFVSISEVYLSFTQAASKFHSEKWNSAVWNEPDGISDEILMIVFPISFLWKQLLQITIGLLNAFRVCSSINSFNSILASCSGLRQVDRIYGPSHTDVRKYLSTKADLQSTGRSRCKEVVRNLVSAIYKTLGLACRQRVLYYIIPQTDFANFIFPISQHLENCQYIIFTRYFVSSYLINTVPSTSHEVFCGFSCFLSLSMQRVSTMWNGGNYASIPPTNLGQSQSEEQYQFLLYYHSLLLENYEGLDQEDISTLKENIKRESTRAFAELFGTIFGIRGPLATQNVGSSNYPTDDYHFSERDSKQERLNRRHDIIHALLSSQRPHYSVLIQPFLQCLHLLLIVGDSVSCKEVLSVIQLFVSFSLKERAFAQYISDQIFGNLLLMILRSESWTIGIEWDIVEGLLEIYRLFIIGIDLKSLVGQNPELAAVLNAFDISEIGSRYHPPITTIPRQKLLETGLISEEEVLRFESDISKLQSKKKQRDLFKDFLRGMMAKVHDPSVLGQLGSNMLFKPPRIQDVKEKEERMSQVTQQAFIGAEYELAKLFE